MPYGNTESIPRFSSSSTHVLFEKLLRLKVVQALGTLWVNSSYIIQCLFILALIINMLLSTILFVPLSIFLSLYTITGVITAEEYSASSAS